MTVACIILGALAFFTGAGLVASGLQGMTVSAIEMGIGGFFTLWMTSTLLAVNQACNSIRKQVSHIFPHTNVCSL